MFASLKYPNRLNAYGRVWDKGIEQPVDATTVAAFLKNKEDRFDVTGVSAEDKAAVQAILDEEEGDSEVEDAVASAPLPDAPKPKAKKIVVPKAAAPETTGNDTTAGAGGADTVTGGQDPSTKDSVSV